MGAITNIGMATLRSAGSLTLNNMGRLTAVQFSSLTSVAGALTAQSCNLLTGSAISAGFGSVVTVVGTLTLRSVSGRSDSMVDLPALSSAGGLYVYQIGSRGVSFPVLATLGAATFYNCGSMHILDFPSLVSFTGRLSITALSSLANLCGFPSLQPAGYTTSAIQFGHSNSNLNQMAAWMATKAGFTGTIVPCSSHPVVIITSLADFTTFASNATLVGASTLGSVVITWTGISNTQLVTLLGAKTTIDELIIDGATGVTSLAALTNLASVTTRLVLQDLPAIPVVRLPALSTVGGTLWLSTMGVCTSIVLDELDTVGGDLVLLNLNRVTSAVFSDLVSVGGALNLRSVSALSGAAFSTAFGSLASVQGTITLWHISRSGPAASTPVVFAALQSTGGLFVREIVSTSMSFPVLITAGRLYWYHNTRMRDLSFPSLRVVTNQIIIVAMTVLPSLCSFDSLQPSGYQSTRNIVFGHSNFNLRQMPLWMATSGSLAGTTECSPHADMIIATQTDYQIAVANSQLMGATRLAYVVITWPAITDAQLTILLQNKVAVDELAISSASTITTIGPALANLVNVSTRIVLNSLPGLQSVTLAALVQVGASVTIENCRLLQSVSMPSVRFIGVDLVLSNNGALILTSFPLLTTVNGSMTLFGDFALPGTAISAGFPVLTTVRRLLQFRRLTTRSSDRRSSIILPSLEYTGGLTLSELGSVTAQFPRLATIAGRFSFYGCFVMTNVSLPSLRSLTGQLVVTAMPAMTSLCGLQGLDQSGYTSSRAVAFGHSTALILEMPAWMAASGGRSGTAECVSLSPTLSPTGSPTASPTTSPTTDSPTASPTESPTVSPTESPTVSPTESPTVSPTESPTASPTESPTVSPTESPTVSPTESPSIAPTAAPTPPPTPTPTEAPTCRKGAKKSKGKGKGKGDVGCEIVRGPSSGAGALGSALGTSGTGSIIVIVAIIFVGLVIVAAAVYIRGKNIKAPKIGTSEIAFENPLYEMGGKPGFVSGDAGDYMDIPVATGHEDATSGYMDIPVGESDEVATTGYMDIELDDDDM